MQCDDCYFGRYEEVKIPYLCQVDEGQVLVPNTPGYQCDYCGNTFYHLGFIRHLHFLIDRNVISGKHESATQRTVTSAGAAGGQPIGRSAKS